MSTLDLEPHEQLDEIDRRTNEDGTVEVRLLDWSKGQSLDKVGVRYEIPTGEVKTESMQWPQSKDNSYKFIRLINETPYTLRTAESINDDDTLRLKANPSSWNLVLPEETSLHEKFPKREDNSAAFEIAKLALYPLSVLGMVANITEKDAEFVGYKEEEYHSTYLEDDKHYGKHAAAIKSALYTVFWTLLILAILV